ncbi:MAG: alpha/beta hydrolase [Lewinella sp.]|uniref:alpha/beta hydrolase n=1 Tax=Lewinella sp. TaxID=2004506 RepID=UPI003D6C5C7C
MKKLILGLLLFAIIVYLGLAYYLSNLVVYPPRRTNAEVRSLMQARAGIDIDTFRQKLPLGEEVTIKVANDLQLAGTYFAQDTSRCAFIISHGYGSTRLSMAKYASFLYDCGCDILLYDHRAHGASGGTYATGGAKEAEDLLVITDWLKEKSGLPATQIAWMGESWGGATVLQAGANNEDVAFIIAESSFQDWESAVFERAERMYGNWITWMKPTVWTIVSWRAGTDAYAASPLLKAKNISEPVLLLHSQADTETASAQSVNVAAALPSGQYRFYHLDWHASHGNNVFVRPSEYQKIIFDFIHDFAPKWETYMQCR